VTPPLLGQVWSAVGLLRVGGWPRLHSLASGRRTDTFIALGDILAGLYVVVDSDGRLRWLGQAHRNGGIAARLQAHLRHAERDRVFAGVYAIAVDPFGDPKALNAAEGRAADLLKLRGRMGGRIWPSSTGWLELVTETYRHSLSPN